MNTGLLLKRPGESKYSTMRRYLIANHGSKAILQKNLRTEVIKYEFISLVAAFENKQIDCYNLPYHLTEISQFDSLTKRPSKCCPFCMSLGFHTEIFELNWLSKCPLHDADLVSQCPNCNGAWRNFSELLKRPVCSCCGLKTKFKKLFSAKIDTSIFELMISLYGREFDLNPDLQFDSENQIYFHKNAPLIETINQFSASNKSIIYLSILNSEKRLFNAEKCQLLKHQIPIVKISKFKFDLDKYQSAQYRKFDPKILNDLADHFLELIHQFGSQNQNEKINFRNNINEFGVNSSIASYVIFAILIGNRNVINYFCKYLSFPNHYIQNKLYRASLNNRDHILGDSFKLGRWAIFKEIWFRYQNPDLIATLCQAELDLSPNLIPQLG